MYPWQLQWWSSPRYRFSADREVCPTGFAIGRCVDSPMSLVMVEVAGLTQRRQVRNVCESAVFVVIDMVGVAAL